MCVVDQRSDQRHDAGDQRRFFMRPVGKECVVGHVGDRRIGPCALDLPQHRESAEAGIEYQDGGETAIGCDASINPRRKPG